MLAARMLNDAVEKYIHQSVPEARTARVVVRVYADLTNLSKQLAKNKVTGLEKRSIAAFTAAFTRAIGLFDFVDALDGEGTRFKIRGMCDLKFILSWMLMQVQNSSSSSQRIVRVVTSFSQRAMIRHICPHWCR